LVGALDEIASVVDPQQTLISIATGVPISVVEEALAGVPVIRAMPNTPSAVDPGTSNT